MQQTENQVQTKNNTNSSNLIFQSREFQKSSADRWGSIYMKYR